MRLGFQARHAAFPVGLHPALDASRVNVEEIRDFLLRIARADAGDGQSPSPLQFGCGSLRSHRILYACP